MTAAIAQIYQLNVTLVDSDPPIWRRLWVPDNCTLAQLHQVLQGAMGWQNMHPYEFDIGRDRPDITHPDITRPDITLGELAPAPATYFRYTYDLASGWVHQVLVEQVLSPKEIQPPYLQCLAGERACPPEACGGIWGYEDILSQWETGDDLDVEALIDWLGGDFDPEAFDPVATNRHLQALMPVT